MNNLNRACLPPNKRCASTERSRLYFLPQGIRVWLHPLLNSREQRDVFELEAPGTNASDSQPWDDPDDPDDRGFDMTLVSYSAAAWQAVR